MNDPYLYEDSSVLRNLLNVHDEMELDIAEAELLQANMMLLYEQGFDDFSTLIHTTLRTTTGHGFDSHHRLQSKTLQTKGL